VRALIGRKLKPRFSVSKAIFRGFIKIDNRLSRARYLNLSSVYFKTPLVDQKPIEIDFSGSLAVIRGVKFESELRFVDHVLCDMVFNFNSSSSTTFTMDTCR
jgi:hypothetical protein